MPKFTKWNRMVELEISTVGLFTDVSEVALNSQPSVDPKSQFQCFMGIIACSIPSDDPFGLLNLLRADKAHQMFLQSTSGSLLIPCKKQEKPQINSKQIDNTFNCHHYLRHRSCYIIKTFTKPYSKCHTSIIVLFLLGSHIHSRTLMVDIFLQNSVICTEKDLLSECHTNPGVEQAWHFHH